MSKSQFPFFICHSFLIPHLANCCSISFRNNLGVGLNQRLKQHIHTHSSCVLICCGFMTMSKLDMRATSTSNIGANHLFSNILTFIDHYIKYFYFNCHSFHEIKCLFVRQCSHQQQQKVILIFVWTAFSFLVVTFSMGGWWKMGGESRSLPQLDFRTDYGSFNTCKRRLIKFCELVVSSLSPGVVLGPLLSCFC